MARTVAMGAAAVCAADLLVKPLVFAPAGLRSPTVASPAAVVGEAPEAAAPEAAGAPRGALALGGLAVAGLAAAAASRRTPLAAQARAAKVIVARRASEEDAAAEAAAEDEMEQDPDPYAAYKGELGFSGGLVGGQSAFSTWDYNFDPLGLSERCFKFLPWFREAELKHGRVAMLAWVGLVVPDFVRLPYDSIPGLEKCYTVDVVAAHNACVPLITDVGTGPRYYAGIFGGPLLQPLLFCLLVEMLTTFPKIVEGLTLENAGDYQFGINFLSTDPIKAKETRLKELKNGRLAMIAFGGAITQATLSGNGFPWLF